MQQRGTGFTNVSKILQANRGNRLGQTVSGGIQQQTQGVQTGVQQAKDKFKQETDKKRLDSEENIEQKQQVLGKFDPNQFNPDASQFKVSSGLSSDYAARKKQYEQEQKKYNKQYETQTGTWQKQISDYQSKIDSTKNAPLTYDNNAYAGTGANRDYINRLQNEVNEIKNRPNTYASQEYGMGAYRNIDRQKTPEMIARDQKELAEKQAELDKQLAPVRAYQEQIRNSEINRYQSMVNQLNERAKLEADARKYKEDEYKKKYGALDKDFSSATEREKQSWLEAEKQRMLSGNMPTEEEINRMAEMSLGAYSGPTELQDVGSLYSKAQQAEQLGSLARSSGGQKELLRKFVGGGADYTSGQKMLDQTLLSQDPSANLGAAARSTRGSISDVQREAMLAGEQGKELVGRAKIFGEQIGTELQAASTPYQQMIKDRLTQYQGKETERDAKMQGIQDLLAGKGDQYKNIDSNTRMGLALQQAYNEGVIDEGTVEKLIGKDGLINRGLATEADLSKLLAERFKTTKAANLNEAGVSTEAERARINALERMQRKQGTDLTFGDKEIKGYQASGGKFDLKSLEQYITKAEAERAKTDPKFAKELKQRVTNAQLIASGAGQVAGSYATPGGLAGIATGDMLNQLGMDLITGGDSTSQAAKGAATVGYGAAKLSSDTQFKIINSLINDTKLGDTEAGRQLSNMLGAGQGVYNKGLGEVYSEGINWADGLSNLTKDGKLDQSLAKLSGFDAAKNLTKDLEREFGDAMDKISSGFGAGTTGRGWDVGSLGAGGGDKTKIKDLAGKSSDEIKVYMDRMAKKIDSDSRGWNTKRGSDIGTGGKYSEKDQAMNAAKLERMMQMYQATLAYERKQQKALEDFYAKGLMPGSQPQQTMPRIRFSDKNVKKDVDYDPKDVSAFMNRIKAASYNYKDEVKDSPLASKNREIGVMAQDLEKSKLGKEAVTTTDKGKIVDYDNLGPKMLASIANLNERLKKMEGK